MDSIENTSFQSTNMDEGDNEQILCTPMKRLALKGQSVPLDSIAGDVILDSSKDPVFEKPKTDVLESIIRKKEPSSTELAATAKLLKRMTSQLAKSNGNDDFVLFLEVLYKLAIKDQTSDRSLLSGISTAADEHFSREGYTTLVSPKQRLFTMCSMAVDTPLPSGATELFISNLENTINESVLVPILETFGTLINLRIPFDAKTEKNRGFAFAIFTKPEGAQEACKKLNQSTLFGKVLLAKITKPKKRLFIGNLPKSRSLEDLQHHFKAFLPGFKQVILPPVITIVKVTSTGIPQASDLIPKRGEDCNQGFCFLEFYGSKEASLAKKVISTRKVFGVDLFVDWAESDESQPASITGNGLSYYNCNIYN